MPGTFTNLLYHIVFSTKSRVPLIEGAWSDELYRYLGGIVRAEGGIVLEIGGPPDHLHLLLKLKPTVALSDTLRLLKANSSKWARENRKSRLPFAWQDGYSAFSVSESQVEHVIRYIRNQREHHATKSSRTNCVNYFSGMESNSMTDSFATDAAARAALRRYRAIKSVSSRPRLHDFAPMGLEMLKIRN
jgi:putative transposase